MVDSGKLTLRSINTMRKEDLKKALIGLMGCGDNGDNSGSPSDVPISNSNGSEERVERVSHTDFPASEQSGSSTYK